eukprot:8203161-Lingulodinium_polyedra.AAC.1
MRVKWRSGASSQRPQAKLAVVPSHSRGPVGVLKNISAVSSRAGASSDEALAALCKAIAFRTSMSSASRRTASEERRASVTTPATAARSLTDMASLLRHKVPRARVSGSCPSPSRSQRRVEESWNAVRTLSWSAALTALANVAVGARVPSCV